MGEHAGVKVVFPGRFKGIIFERNVKTCPKFYLVMMENETDQLETGWELSVIPLCLRNAMDIEKLHTELAFRTSRSSGSGGQHVNKVSTRVELLFDIAASTVLNDKQKALLSERLSNRIRQNGELQLACSATRSQHRNKELVIAKFDELIRQALRPRVKRKKVPRSRQANPKARLQKKRRRSEKKALRRKIKNDY